MARVAGLAIAGRIRHRIGDAPCKEFPRGYSVAYERGESRKGQAAFICALCRNRADGGDFARRQIGCHSARTKHGPRTRSGDISGENPGSRLAARRRAGAGCPATLRQFRTARPVFLASAGFFSHCADWVPGFRCGQGRGLLAHDVAKDRCAGPRAAREKSCGVALLGLVFGPHYLLLV